VVNERTERLIKSFEEPKGPRLKARKDTIATLFNEEYIYDIGWGHVITGHEEPDIFKPGQMMSEVTITKEQAQELFESDLKKFIGGVTMRLNPDKKRALSEDSFGALVSLAYNIGLEGFNKSAVRATINMANPKDAIHGFRSWVGFPVP
jgi:GH24 family phage-related lysozyme (muramidase)